MLQIVIKPDANRGESLIFAPGEPLTFEMTAALANPLHGTTVDIQTALIPVRKKEAKEIPWSDKQRVSVPVDGQLSLMVNVPLQVPEGVYTVRVSITRSAGYFRDRFLPLANTPLAEQSFELVVLDPRPPSTSAAGSWERVLEIDPTNPRWVERLPSWTQFNRIPGLNHGPLGSIRAAAVDLPLGRFIELPPTAVGSEPHWQAYSLPLEAVGTPHALEIDYPGDEEQHFGLSIVEPNAAGVVEGIHRDAGVFVDGLGAARRSKSRRSGSSFGRGHKRRC